MPRPICLLLLCIAALSAEDVFVAPDGNDAWSGRISVANEAKTDGPFASLARAQQAVRALKRGGAKGPITVRLRGGRYELKEPLVLTPEDSGTAEAAIEWTSAHGESPIISGGVRLTGFTADAKGRWTLRIPEVQRGEWTFSQLWVNGERRYRPRVPKDTYHFIEAELPPSPAAAGKGFDRFRFAKGDLDPGWKNLADVEVLTFHQWEMSRFRIREIDAAARTVQFTGHTICAEPWTALKTGWRYIAENVAEALDEPGEWYLDRPTGTLTYIPMPGEDLAKAEIIAPRTAQLLLIQGDPAKGAFVDHLIFRELTFAHTAWTLKPEGYSFYQAEMIIPATIAAIGLRDTRFISCIVAHTGGYGMELGRGCKRTSIEGSVLDDLSAGGVKIGEGGVEADDALVASHNTVASTIISHAGRVHPAGIGVWIGQSHHNTVRRCGIHDLYYSAISLGWTWGYGPSHAHHNIVEHCHLSRIGQGVLSDMGGIYNLGVSPGTIFHHNLIHDIESFSYGGWGLYTDEGSSGVTMENNLCHRTTSSGFHQHYGRDNVVRNNIFAYGGEAQLMRTRDEEHRSFTLERNIMLAKSAPMLGSNWNGDAKKFMLDRNVYWDEDGSVDFAGKPLEEWRKKGVDANSLVADPQFVDPARGDFTLKPDSPALKLGFEPFRVHAAFAPGYPSSEIVHYLKAHPVTPTSRANRAFPPKPGPPPPAPIADGFEETPVGQRATGAVTSRDPAVPTADILVVEGSSAGGKRNLRFIDAPGQRNGFDPHLYYEPRFTAGMVTGSFALRVEPGAVLMHEWRTSGHPYHTGPALRVDGDGQVSVGGKELLRIPRDGWSTFSITTGLGPEANGTWTLAVTLPGAKEPQRFPGLPCSGDFRALNWYGFVSDATQAASFSIDDLSLGPAR